MSIINNIDNMKSIFEQFPNHLEKSYDLLLEDSFSKPFWNESKYETQRINWKNAPKDVADLLVNWMGPFHEGREWLQRDEAQRSIGMAMQTLMLAAKAMGYESCPMIGFDIDKVAELINLPEDHVLGPMVAIGKGTKDPWPKPGQLPLSDLVKENSF